MADDIILNAGSGGDTVAADEIGGKKHQRIKIQYGDDGAATDVSDTNPLPIDDAGGSITVDATSLPLPTGAATSAAQLADGHNVTVDNASGGSAVNIQDGGNSITIDGTVTASNVSGDVAHDAADSGNPVKIGGKANAGFPTAVAESDRVDASFDLQGQLRTHETNLISTNNSTTSTLANDAVFTGTGDDVSQYCTIVVILDSSHDSATNGMTFQFSPDNTNWDEVHSFTYTTGDARHFQFPTAAQYFRIVYTNGGTTQTAFRVQTILHKKGVNPTIHRLVDNIDPDEASAVVKSIVSAQAAGSGDFVPIQATAGGNFKVSMEEINGVTPSLNTGVRDAGTQRVTVATDDLVPISAASLPLPAGAATSAAQLADGHNVTVDNAAGASAVNIQDGGNSLTVDTTADATDGAAHGASQTGFRAMGTDGVNDQQVRTDATGFLQVIGDDAHNDPDSGNASLKVGGVAGLTMPTPVGDGDRVDASFDLQGQLRVIPGVYSSGGTTPYKNLDVDESEDSVKGSTGQIYWIHCMNLTSSPLYLKLYNATVASVIVGTTAPDLTFPIPTQGDTNGAGFTLSIPNGIEFGVAITIACTTGIADSDTGAPGANACVVNIGYT